MSRWLLVWLVALSLLPGLGLGCAGFGQGLSSPEVSLVDLRPLPSATLEQRFEMRVRVLNPNDVALSVDGVDLILDINGRRLGRAVSSESFSIPRLSDSVVVLVATTHWLDVVHQIAALPKAADLEYALHGRLFLADSAGWLGFEQEGSLLPEAVP